MASPEAKDFSSVFVILCLLLSIFSYLFKLSLLLNCRTEMDSPLTFLLANSDEPVDCCHSVAGGSRVAERLAAQATRIDSVRAADRARAGAAVFTHFPSGF